MNGTRFRPARWPGELRFRDESLILAEPRPDRPIVETTTEAREGSTPGVARYVLILGPTLAIRGFVILVLVIRG
jgi:hypothetical protein